MHRMTIIASLALALTALSSSPAPAQQATFTAVIQPATMPSICQEETHFVECNGALLKSTTLDLNKYVGKPYEFVATLGGVTCPIWNVTAVHSASATLTQCGSAVPGCPMRLRVGPTGVIGQWFLWYSGSPDFVPLDPITGTVMLGSPFTFAATGQTFGATAAYDFVIPSAPGLVGLKIYAQGARRDIGPVGPLTLTNPTCFTILPPMPPCILPSC